MSAKKSTPSAGGFFVVLLLGAAGWHWLFGNSDPSDTTATTATEVAPAAVELTPEQIAAKEKMHSLGHHCLSPWDGSHPALVRAVEKQLTDPASFEHIETITWPVRHDGRNAIVMQFTARNGFGGMVKGKAAGSFDNESCSDVQLDTIE